MAEENVETNIDIPIQRTDLIIFENVVSSVKEKFINEIKIMDEEINKLNTDLVGLYVQSSTVHANMPSVSESIERQSPSKSQGNRQSLTSPLVEGEGSNRTLKLHFDVSQFDPAEVTVKIKNEMLVVSATHEEKKDNSSILRQFHREFKFPKGVNPTTVSSTLSKDGVLIVQAPLPQLAITDESDRPT